MALWDGSWLINSGQSGVYASQRALVVVAVMPSLWFFLHQNFDAMIGGNAFMFVTALGATGWACYRIRCRVCGMPVYAIRVMGLPRKNREWFEGTTECPYCLDDGTGTVGNPQGVDQPAEIRKAWGLLLKGVLFFVGLLSLYLIPAVMGLMPV